MTTSTPPPESPQLPPSSGWQFSLGWLVFAMTVAAAIAGLVRLVHNPTLRVVLVAYLIVVGIYMVLRLPYIVGPLFANSKQRRAIRQHRQQLADWAEERRSEKISIDSTDVNSDDQDG